LLVIMRCTTMQRRGIKEIETEVENMGATLNAYTSRESTAYYARCIGRDIGPAMDVLGDMVMNSKLESGAIARERDVILREAKEVRMRLCIRLHLHFLSHLVCTLHDAEHSACSITRCIQGEALVVRLTGRV
jgi:predicted Zn-dependent peptidase